MNSKIKSTDFLYIQISKEISLVFKISKENILEKKPNLNAMISHIFNVFFLKEIGKLGSYHS
jgi:hypothetical protein